MCKGKSVQPVDWTRAPDSGMRYFAFAGSKNSLAFWGSPVRV
jgi:hypothetical protein